MVTIYDIRIEIQWLFWSVSNFMHPGHKYVKSDYLFAGKKGCENVCLDWKAAYVNARLGL